MKIILFKGKVSELRRRLKRTKKRDPFGKGRFTKKLNVIIPQKSVKGELKK